MNGGTTIIGIDAATEAKKLGLARGDARLVGCDDRLDAMLCVLAGADFLRGWCVAPDDGQRGRAEVEGWIWFKDPRVARGC